MSMADATPIPPEFICTISKDIMIEPVQFNCCKQHIDFPVLHLLMFPEKGRPSTKCPCCNTPDTLAKDNWVYNKDLQSRIEKFRDEHPAAVKQYNQTHSRPTPS